MPKIKKKFSVFWKSLQNVSLITTKDSWWYIRTGELKFDKLDIKKSRIENWDARKRGQRGVFFIDKYRFQL